MGTHTKAGALMSSIPKVWDDIAENYDADRSGDAIYSSAIDQVIRDAKPSGHILDAGCGTGLVTMKLLHRASSVTALDFSGESLERLRRKAGNQVKYVQGDLTSMDFPSASFDTVICANTLQHLTPIMQVKAIAELLRVLKPGGSYAVSVHHYSRAKIAAGWKKEGKPGQAGVDYIFRFSRDDLSRLLPGSTIRAVGFDTANLFGPFASIGQRCMAMAGEWLARAGHGHMLIARGSS